MVDKKRILIPGGAGYIGSHVVLCCLLTRRYKVTVIENYSNSFGTALERVEKIALDALPKDAPQEDRDACKIDVIQGDMRDRATFKKAFQKYSGSDAIYAIILTAALKSVGESSSKPIDYYEVNTSGLIGMLAEMKEAGCGRLIYSSSATVYGTPKTIPIPESSPMQAESVYGRTKQIAELIIKDVCDGHPDFFRSISLRYFNPAGAHPSGLIGEDPRGKPGNLLPLLAQMAVGKYREPGLKVFGNDYPTPDGTCVRDYIHIMDLAGGHVNALDAVDDDSKFHDVTTPGKFKAYNLGKGKGLSVLNMIEAMRKVSGYEYPYEVVGRRLGDVPDLTADPSLAEKELGFKAKYSLDDMSRDTWNWQSKNPKGYDTE